MTYQNKECMFPTMHRKHEVVAPIFNELLGLEVTAVEVDTDQFGTFSGEVARVLPVKDTLRKKIESGFGTKDGQIAVASEGSISPHPYIPFVTANMESLMFVDKEKGFELTVSHLSTDIVAEKMEVSDYSELNHFLLKADFPNHGLMVIPKDPIQLEVCKGIRDESELAEAIKVLVGKSRVNRVVVQNDFRAHMSPTRMKNIGDCARKLAIRIAQKCPKCSQPGWGAVSSIYDARCEYCESKLKSVVSGYQNGCVTCDYVEVEELDDVSNSSKWCDFCNP